jgi:hypothetical protein
MMRDLIPPRGQTEARRSDDRRGSDRDEALSAALSGLAATDLSLERWLDRLEARR